MILVAVLVCFFAVGMAGLLDYYKYRSTADHIVRDRLLVTGNSIEASIQSSLVLGLHLSDIGTLLQTMERERATDGLIRDIEVFDAEGSTLYTTDRERAGQKMPTLWLAAAQAAGDKDWSVEDANNSAVGLAIKNNFGLKIGHLAIRFSDDRIQATRAAVARELGSSALGIFAVAAALASALLLAVMGRLARHVAAVEATLRSGEPARLPAAVRAGPFGAALNAFFETVRRADTRIVALRASLTRGGGQ